MLSSFRKAFHGSRVLMAVLMTIILLGLLAYLGPHMSYGSSSDASVSVLARVYGREILRRDVDMIVYDMLRSFGKDANSEELIPFLTNQALSKLVRIKLMEELAERHGVVVTDLELKHTLESHLKRYGFVGRDGKLLPSAEINNILLETNGLSLKWFENSIVSDLTVQKLLQQAAVQVPVDSAWLDSEIRVRNEKLGLEFVTVAPDTTCIANPELSKLEAFYKESGARFQVGPRRVIDYVLLTPATINLSPIDDSALKTAYNANIGQFTELRASHILFKAINDNELREASKKAKELRARLLTGYDFGKAAVALSQDPSAKNSKGNLGWFQLGRMEKSFEHAAMALKVGEISEPVQTSFGVHIIRLEGRREKSFDQVKDEFRSRLTRERFTIKAKDQLEQLRKRIGRHGDLTSAARKLGLSAQISYPFLKDSPRGVIGLPDSQELVREAFLAKVGAVSQVKQFQDGFIVFRVREERQAAIPAFDEIKEEVLAAWRLEEARRVAMDRARNAIKSGNLKMVGAPVTRSVTTIAGLGVLGEHPAIRRALLDTPAGQLTPILWTSGGKLWVAHISSRISAAPLSFADRRALIEQVQMGVAKNMLGAELENMEKVGNGRSGLRSFYGRFGGIWYNKKALSAIGNSHAVASGILG